MATNSQKKVIYIICMGHSGSTLLDMILGSHPKVFGVGEITKLRNNLPQICGVCEGECEFWINKASSNVLDRYFNKQGIYKKIINQLSRIHRNIYSYLSEWFGYEVFVDSSKRIAWIESQLKHKRHWKHTTPYLIYLTRDGRAVVNSRLRKYPDNSIENITTEWTDQAEKLNYFYEKYRGEKFEVKYEDLATKPEETVRELCNALQLDYIPKMLNYWEHDHHNIGGNSGTRSLIEKKRGKIRSEMQETGAQNMDYYENVEPQIKLDLRWKSEISEEYISFFETHSRGLNERFRYDG